MRTHFFNALARRRSLHVISHERSGTHLALNLFYRNLYIRQNFYDMAVWRGPYTDAADAFNHWRGFRQLWDAGWMDSGGLVKSHCEASVFRRFFPKEKVIYVLRDPRDTLVSFFHYLNHPALYENNPWMADQRCANFQEFLTRPLSDFLRWGFSFEGAANNVMERWANHVRGWMDDPHAKILLYDDLIENYRRTMYSTALAVGAFPKLNMSPVRFGEGKTILPRKGKSGDWKNYFSREDEVELSEVLKARMLNFQMKDAFGLVR